MTDLPNRQLSTQISAVSDATGKNTLSADEKKERNQELAKAVTRREAHASGLAEKSANLSDVVNAREAERRTLESEQTGWLAKNVHHLLAIGIMGLTFGLYTVVILGGSKDGFLKPETKDIVIYILGALTTVATQIVSYYFGSSSGSASKSNALSAIAKRK